MINTLRAEFKKFFTVRSTYIWTGLTFALIGFVSFYGFGYSTSIPAINEPGFMMGMMSTVISMFATIGTILAILLVAHEYRYNTINYTLTASPSRLRVLLAKITVMLTYATVIGIILLGMSYIATRFGLSLKGVSLGDQHLPLWDTLWRFWAYLWGYVLAGVIIAAIVRGLVGSIVLFFIMPAIEQMSMFLLKENSKFLPFTSIDSLIGSQTSMLLDKPLTHVAALGLTLAYISVGLIVAGILFVRRDAS